MTIEYWESQGYDSELHDLVLGVEGAIKGYIVKPVHVPIRRISKRSMMVRFTLEERQAIKEAQNSQDVMVQVFMEELMASQSIDLDNENLLYALTYLSGQGIITPSRISELTQDATAEESWR